MQRLKARFFNRCTRLVNDLEPSSLVSLKSDRVIVFLSGPQARDARSLEQLTSRLQALGREVADLSVSVGVSRFTADLSGLRKAFEEALAALKVGRKLQGLGSTMHFESVGSYKLLLSIWEHEPGELRALYAETIEPVDRYDKQNDSQLVHTLVTFLGNDENLSKTAQDLYAHRHTIRYRLQKIARHLGSERVPQRGQGAAEPGAQGAELCSPRRPRAAPRLGLRARLTHRAGSAIAAAVVPHRSGACARTAPAGGGMRPAVRPGGTVVAGLPVGLWLGLPRLSLRARLSHRTDSRIAAAVSLIAVAPALVRPRRGAACGRP